MKTSSAAEPEQTPDIAALAAATMKAHRYALGHEGICADGEVAWLLCTCGWSLNYEMEYDDIRLAEAVWEQHQVDALAAALAPVLAAAEREAEQRTLREVRDATLAHFGTWGGAGWAAWLDEYRADRITGDAPEGGEPE